MWLFWDVVVLSKNDNDEGVISLSEEQCSVDYWTLNTATCDHELIPKYLIILYQKESSIIFRIQEVSLCFKVYLKSIASCVVF